MTTNSIKAHYEALRESDKDSWNQLNADLARQDYLTHFQRRILPIEGYDLRDTPSWTRTCLIKFVPGFSHDNFDDNTLPELLTEQAA